MKVSRMYKKNALDLIDWVKVMNHELGKKFMLPNNVFLAGGSLLRKDSPDRDLFIVYRKRPDALKNSHEMAGAFMGLNKVLGFDHVTDLASGSIDTENHKLNSFKLNRKETRISIDIIPIFLDETDYCCFDEVVEKTFPLSIQEVYFDFYNEEFHPRTRLLESPIYVKSGTPISPKFSLLKYVDYYPNSEFLFSAKALKEVLNNNDTFKVK